MKKGQISFDLLITLIVVVIVVSAFTQIISSIKTNQEIVLLEDQLKTIAEKTANTITATQTISDTNFYIEIKISKINYGDEKGANQTTYPKIIITDQNKLTLYTNLSNGQRLDANAYFYTPSNVQIITNAASTTGILVIKSA
jgi:hypothetical protein